MNISVSLQHESLSISNMEVLEYIWQLPQTIAAFIYFTYLSNRNEILDTCTFQGAIVFIKKNAGGSVTLGNHIFLSPKATDNTVRHEWGHTRQSLLLGPLYLIIIGIPSIVWAAIHKRVATTRSYYLFYTESWAVRLGGVIRKY